MLREPIYSMHRSKYHAPAVGCHERVETRFVGKKPGGTPRILCASFVRTCAVFVRMHVTFVRIPVTFVRRVLMLVRTLEPLCAEPGTFVRRQLSFVHRVCGVVRRGLTFVRSLDTCG